jgi:hypothetical protein
MKNISVLFFILMIGVSSCGKLYLRLRYDVRSFKARDTQDLVSYLKSKGITYDRHYRINKKAFDAQSVSSYKPDWPSGLRPVQVRAFDSNGEMFMQWAICEGFLDSMATLKSFPPVNEGAFDPNTLSQDLLQYTTSDGSIPDVSGLPAYDLCFVVYWTRALGEMSLQSIRSVTAYRDRYPDKRILLLMVSLDPEKEWKKER